MRPNEYFVYDGNVPYSKRVDKVIDWLTGKGGLQTQLAILYMDKVDKAGHEYGPNSEGVSPFFIVPKTHDIINDLAKTNIMGQYKRVL